MAKNFLGNCLSQLCTAGCIIFLVLAVPIAQITLGAVYIDECPAAPAIPVYVMVSGIVVLLLKLMLLGLKFLCPAGPSNTVWTLSTFGLALFAFIWLIFGSYHIYSIYPPNYSKIAIDPDCLNNGISTPTSPGSKISLTSKNQNQSNPNLNCTWMINESNNNQTLLNLTESLTTSNISSQINLTETLASVNSSSEANGEHLNAPQTSHVAAARSYCQRTVYLFAFWATTIIFVFAGLTLVVSICVFGFLKKKDIL